MVGIVLWDQLETEWPIFVLLESLELINVALTTKAGYMDLSQGFTKVLFPGLSVFLDSTPVSATIQHKLMSEIVDRFMSTG